MYFNAIRENKIIVKISGFTVGADEVSGVSGISKTFCFIIQLKGGFLMYK